MTDMKKKRFLSRESSGKKSHERCTLKNTTLYQIVSLDKKVIYAHILNKSILSLLHCITKTDLMAPKLPTGSEKLENTISLDCMSGM
jgi:hypothetical protein